MDEAFMPFRDVIAKMLAFPIQLRDEEEGVTSTIYECEIESPVEMDVYRADDGSVVLGTTPPLYYVNTSFKPSFHHIRFKAIAEEIDAR
jgi:hypothetical protein